MSGYVEGNVRGVCVCDRCEDERDRLDAHAPPLHHAHCHCVLCEHVSSKEEAAAKERAAADEAMEKRIRSLSAEIEKARDATKPWVLAPDSAPIDKLGDSLLWRATERVAEERLKDSTLFVPDVATPPAPTTPDVFDIARRETLADQARIRAEAIHLCVMAFEAKLDRGDLLGLVNREWRAAFGGGL